MLQQWKPTGRRRVFPSGKIFRVLLVIALSLLLVTISIAIITIAPWYKTRLQVMDNPFVTRSGTSLMVHGSPLRLIGYNWHWMGTNCPTPTDADINATFSQIVTASYSNVIRTAFYQGASNNGVYTDFDRYIRYARHYGLYIVPMLVNQLASCEPIKIMERGIWYKSGYKQPGDGYPLSFRDYALRLAQHYANEPEMPTDILSHRDWSHLSSL